MPADGLLFRGNGFDLFPVRLFIVAIIGIGSILVRQVSVFLRFRFSATEIFLASLLFAILFSAIVFFCYAFLLASVSDICSISFVHGKVYHFLHHYSFLSDVGFSPTPVG